MDQGWEEVAQSMALLLELHRELGASIAEIEWINCYDINHSSHHYKSLASKIGTTESKIRIVKEDLSQLLSSEQIDELLLECTNSFVLSKETMEQKIELEHRPSGVHFNKDALIILTETAIPDDIKIALSFGHKFLFPFECNNDNMNEILAQLEMSLSCGIHGHPC